MDRDNRTDNREDGVMYADEFLNVGFCVGTVVEPYTGCVPTCGVMWLAALFSR